MSKLPDLKEIAKFVDHTNVKPDATSADIKKLCSEAVKYGFHSVCVTPYRVSEARQYLGEKSKIKIICVVGFPFGFTTTAEKVFEAKTALQDGASEIDMVINIGAVKEGRWQYIKEEINQITRDIKPIGLKVIMEVGFLTSKELNQTCKIAKAAGAAFVKTATGYGPRGAKVTDIKLMRQAVGQKMGIKAAGGIHDFATALAMIKAGANRVGTSSSLQIIGALNAAKKHHSKIKKQLSNE